MYVYKSEGEEAAYFTPGRVGFGGPGSRFLCCLFVVYVSVCSRVGRRRLTLATPPATLPDYPLATPWRHPGDPPSDPLGDPPREQPLTLITICRV